MVTVLSIVILLAGAYMAWNIGANDAANAIGTSVGSGALTLKKAVIVAALLEFCGAFFFGSYVSKTVEEGILRMDTFNLVPMKIVFGMLASLLAAGIWLQLASFYGWPVSTTHSLIGAIVGFGLFSGGVEAVDWRNIGFIVSSWVISPILGAVCSYLFFSLIQRKILHSAHPFHAALRLRPWIIFLATALFSLFILVSASKGSNPELSLELLVLTAVALGILVALFSHYVIPLKNKLKERKRLSALDQGVSEELAKVQLHLEKIQTFTKGQLYYQIEDLKQEVDHLTLSVENDFSHESHDSEYDAVEAIFAQLQLISAGCIAFAHGANDVANAIGPIAACFSILENRALIFPTTVPTDLLVLGGGGIVLGLATWGWRVIETIGKKITALTPSRGFAAEISAAFTIVGASKLGLPISTTHTLVGAVIGIAFTRGIGAINLATTRDIIISWFITVPAGAALAVLIMPLLEFLFPL